MARAAIKPNLDDKLLTVDEVAERLSLTPRQIYRLVNSGDFLPPIKIGKSSRWAESELAQWIEFKKDTR